MGVQRCYALLAVIAALLVLSAFRVSRPEPAAMAPATVTPPPAAPLTNAPTGADPWATSVVATTAPTTAATSPTVPVSTTAVPATATPATSTTTEAAPSTTVPTTTEAPSTTQLESVLTDAGRATSNASELENRSKATPVPSTTPKPLPVDKLGAHPLESSFVQGHEDPHVRALARVMTPLVSHGYYYGFVSLGGGNVFSMKSQNEFDFHQKGRAITGAGGVVATRNAVKQFSNGSIVIMWVGDTSPFCYADAREIIAKLNAGQGFGRLWWLTYNPCILDAAGRIGEYEIPIPSFDLMTYNDLGLETRKFPMSERSRKVVWRGQTTGVGDDGDYRYNRWGNYRTCHRYKVVESFNRFAEAHPEVEIDVKFTGNDINSQGMVPAAYWGNYTKSSTVSAQIQLDVDGNGISWLGVRRKLGSGSVVMRAFSNMTQFYFPWLKNGTHILVYNTTDELAAAAHHLLRAPQSEATREWMTNITRRAAEIADQLATGAMLDGYLYGRIVNATSEYDADKDWRIRR